jgi:hypothetical protein
MFSALISDGRCREWGYDGEEPLIRLRNGSRPTVVRGWLSPAQHKEMLLLYVWAIDIHLTSQWCSGTSGMWTAATNGPLSCTLRQRGGEGSAGRRPVRTDENRCRGPNLETLALYCSSETLVTGSLVSQHTILRRFVYLVGRSGCGYRDALGKSAVASWRAAFTACASWHFAANHRRGSSDMDLSV